MEKRRAKEWHLDSRWITIGRKGKDGEKQGSHVLIDDNGVIEKGPAALMGKSLKELKKGGKKVVGKPTGGTTIVPKEPKSVEPSHKIRDKIKLTPEEKAKFDAVDASNIVYNDPDSVELYKLLKSGKYFKRKYLRDFPIVKKLEKEARKWEKKVYDKVSDTSDERKAARQKILDDFLEAGSYSGTVKGEDGVEHDSFEGDTKKGYEAYIVIGWPASGKSSKIVNPLSKEKGAFVLDSDLLKERYPEYIESKGAAASAVTPDAGYLRRKALREFTEGSRKGDNLVVPILGRTEDAVNSFLEELERAGYNVHIKHRPATRREAANRMIMRALETGRIVPLSAINKEGGDPEDVYNSFKGKTNRSGSKYIEE